MEEELLGLGGLGDGRLVVAVDLRSDDEGDVLVAEVTHHPLKEVGHRHVVGVHGGEEVIRPTELLIKGALCKQFWIFVVGLGIMVPIALILWPSESLLPNVIASLFVLEGLWLYENLWIKAGQAVPLS